MTDFQFEHGAFPHHLRIAPAGIGHVHLAGADSDSAIASGAGGADFRWPRRRMGHEPDDHTSRSPRAAGSTRQKIIPAGAVGEPAVSGS